MTDLGDWNKVLTVVAKKIGPQEFRAWLEPTKLLEIKGNNIIISVPTAFHGEWIKEHFKEHLRRAAHDTLGLSIADIETIDGLEQSKADAQPHNIKGLFDDFIPRITEETPADAPSAISPKNILLNGEFCELPSKPKTSNTAPGHIIAAHSAENTQDSNQELNASHHAVSKVKTIGERIISQNTFDNFVVGSSNQFAHAACRAVAEFPAGQYNPLFIYSSAGLGKTHLLHAIANNYLQNHPKAKICYLSAETFTNDLIESIRQQQMPNFRQKYRDSFDMLLMDDFQFIAGKDRTQEEFFHTFNSLHQSQRQIVVTSDKPPNEIPGLEERIRTRFECGLIADIQPPEIETRIAILRAKAERDDIFLPEDVALFLASNIKSNIRELEGVLIRLEAQASLNGVEISLELARKELASRIKEPIFAVSADTILSIVAQHFGVKVADLKGPNKSRKYSMPRQIAMYLLRRYTQRSLPEIGLCVGGKDHTTVLYGINCVTTALETDDLVKKHVTDIQNAL